MKRLIQIFLYLFISVVIFAGRLTTDDDIQSRESYCSEELSRKNRGCFFDDSIKSIVKNYTGKYAKKQLEYLAPYCDVKKNKINEGYFHNGIEKYRMLVERFGEEIIALGGPTTEEIIKKWYFDNRPKKSMSGTLGFPAETISKIIKRPYRWDVLFVDKSGNERKVEWHHLETLPHIAKELAYLKGQSSKEFPSNIPMVKGKEYSPKHGLKVPNGWLLGSDHGRYGGDLIYVNEDHKVKVLLNDTIKGIYRTPAGIIAITGQTYHEFYGYVVKVIEEDKEWAIKEMVPIFSYPNFVEQNKDGTLLIESYFGPFYIDGQGVCRVKRERNREK
jgi:hypothetical protein